MWIKISKLFYALLIMYYGWFQVIFFQIPNMLLIFGIGMLGSIILHAIQKRENLIKSLTIELNLWILFALTSLLFGMLIAVNQEFLLNSIITYIQFLVLMYGIIYISNQDGNVEFFIKFFIFYAVTSAITTLFWGVDYGQGRISMEASNNPNTLGITMALGVCCILYKHNFKKLGYSLIAFSTIFLLIYVCLLTGSRKSFLSIVLIIIYWFLLVVPRDIKFLSNTAKIKGVFSLLLLVAVGYYFLYPYVIDSILFSRLTSLFESGSDTREGMYAEAFTIFKQSPIVGVGFNNYRELSIYGTYSHSTYAELLACTGIIGSFLYFSAYIKLLFNFTMMSTRKYLENTVIKQARIMLGLFGILLFLGTGIIHIYEMSSSIAIGMLIAFYKVNKKNIKYPEI